MPSSHTIVAAVATPARGAGPPRPRRRTSGEPRLLVAAAVMASVCFLAAMVLAGQLLEVCS